MTKLQEIIEDLPKEMRPFANIALPILMGWAEADAIDWLNAFMGDNLDYRHAKKVLFEAMTTEQRNAEQERQVKAQEAMNYNNAALMNAQREAIWTIFFRLLAG